MLLAFSLREGNGHFKPIQSIARRLVDILFCITFEFCFRCERLSSRHRQTPHFHGGGTTRRLSDGEHLLALNSTNLKLTTELLNGFEPARLTIIKCPQRSGVLCIKWGLIAEPCRRGKYVRYSSSFRTEVVPLRSMPAK